MSTADLELKETAKRVLKEPLHQLPVLASERTLVDQEEALALATEQRLATAMPWAVEVIGMPRKTYGTRPLTILEPCARTYYEALAKGTTAWLESPSRATPFTEHTAFGSGPVSTEEQRIVDADIAACYEYISHPTLAEELVLQGAPYELVELLHSFLNAISQRQVGIPQALEGSHLLADAYLARLERAIARTGRPVHRYADDFRIVCSNWTDAHQAIEQLSTEARSVGLALAEGKVNIRSARQIREDERAKEALFDDHKARAADTLRTIEFIQTGYDDFDLEEVDAGDVEVDAQALRTIIEEWVGESKEISSVHPRLVALALHILTAAEKRLEDDLLIGVLERDPIRLPAVAKYVSTREGEVAENWKTLSRLTKLERLGPWSRIWILSTAATLPRPKGRQSKPLLDWAVSQLESPLETVRAEAAALLALHHRVKVEKIAQLYVRASGVTRLALAGTVGTLDGGHSSSVGQALRDESALNRIAYRWGAEKP